MAGKKSAKSRPRVPNAAPPTILVPIKKSIENPTTWPSREYLNALQDPNARIHNGTMEGALFPGISLGVSGAPVSQHDTLYDALRWYIISNERNLITQLYAELACVRNFINVPVDDALAGGINIHSKQLGDQNCNDMQMVLEAEGCIEKGAGQGEKWARCFGGGGTLFLTGQDWNTPFNIEAITANEPVDIRSFDLWEMFGDTVNADGWDQGAGAYLTNEFYNYYGQRVHKTHMVKMLGAVAPSQIRPRMRGWGLSELEALVRSMNQFLKSNNIDFELLDEAKVDVFLMKNLVTTLLSSDGEQQVRRRVDTANRSKNYRKALVMDSEDKYEQKQITFAGLADLKKEFRIQWASDARIPMLKLYGFAAAGLNTSSEEELEVYNTMVEGGPRRNMRPAILTTVKIKCQQRWGSTPTDLTFTYQPLRQLTAAQEQEVKDKKFNRVVLARDKGLISDQQAAAMINKDKLLPLPIEVESLDDTVGEDKTVQQDDPAGGEKKEKKE